MPDAASSRAKAYGCALLTLLAPGLGHWVLGRRARAAAFFAIVVVTFFAGLALGGALFPFRAENWLFRLAAIGQAGLGLPYFLARAGGFGVMDAERATAIMFGYGNTFLVASGLMNMLLAMDVFDIAIGRKP